MKKTCLAGLLSFVVLPVVSGNVWITPADAQILPVSDVCRGESLDRLAVFGREKIRLIAESGKKGSDAVEAMPVSFLVMGEVNCPGEFNLPAPVTLLDAVAAAGGPSVDGSLRKVRVDRSGKPALEADLYDFFVDERPVSDFYLAEGDVITFQAGGSLVKFSGQVSRAGIFEMLPGEMTLEKALLLTGSFSGPFSACKVEILRNIGGYKRAFFTIQLAESEKAPAMPLLDGDEIRVSECRLVPEKIVLTGYCHKAEVVYGEGLRLSEVLAGKVLKEDTALEYGEILRKTSGAGYEEVLSFVPEQILHGNNHTDVTLRPGDKVVLFSKKFLSENPVVSVEGMVARPGRFVLDGETDIRKMIMMAGGIRSTKANLALELARRELVDGKLQYSRLEINLASALQGDPRHNLKLRPFDSLTIYCP